MATEIGALQVRVGADVSGLTTGLAQAGDGLSALGQTATSALNGLDIASSSVFNGLETTISRAARGGETSFDGMVSAMLRSLERLTTRNFITGPLHQLFNGLFEGLSFGGARANGGLVSAGEAYLVGERGPELFVPGASGTIVPNSAQRASIVFNVQTPDAQSFLMSETQIGAMLARAAARGQRNL